MKGSGSALMGIGRATGDNRAAEAAKSAIDSPLLEVAIDGARGILFTITGGNNLTMNEISEASRVITASADQNAKIIFGSVIDDTMKDEVKVTVVATGFGPGIPRVSPAARQMPQQETQPIVRGSSYTPPPAPQPSNRSIFHEQKPMRPAAPLPPPPPAAQKDDATDEDELEIPAFIRKKMM